LVAPTNQTLGIENSVGGVHGDLILGCITDQPFGVSESHVGRSRTVSLVIGDDLNTIVLPHTNARIGGTEIDTDRRTFTLAGHLSGTDLMTRN
jgi:hypothetical protein